MLLVSLQESVAVATQNALFEYELVKTRYTLNLAFKKIYNISFKIKDCFAALAMTRKKMDTQKMTTKIIISGCPKSVVNCEKGVKNHYNTI